MSLTQCYFEVEGTLNARPLIEEYEEFEGEVLTPSHLIYGRAIIFIPERGEGGSWLRTEI